MISRRLPRGRREFLRLGAGAVAATAVRRGLGQTAHADGVLQATLTIRDEPLASMAPDFSGLSYELAQLANPEFFAASNGTLIQLFRELSPRGVLRLGGGTSEFTSYSDQTMPGPPPFEVFGPDTSSTGKKGTITTARALENLRAFLDATGWQCLYGLNLGQGTQENAVREAAAVHRILGPRLLALQIGNEPDSFRNRFRSPGYGPTEFVREWRAFHDVIAGSVPQARFAGPDISNKLAYLTAFADEVAHLHDVVLLTGHYYGMGPAGRPDATIVNLLSDEPRSTTMKWSGVDVVRHAMQTTQLPYRVSEMNSCWNGGQRGVSDTFASALWCADIMLRFASLGFCGVNLHGGGDGIYSPIVGSPGTGIRRRPEYFGMQFAQRFAGSTLLRTELHCGDDRVRVYAARSAGQRPVSALAILNKSDRTAMVQVAADGPSKGRRPRSGWNVETLSAPAVDATTGIHLATSGDLDPFAAAVQVMPFSAVHLTRVVE